MKVIKDDTGVEHDTDRVMFVGVVDPQTNSPGVHILLRDRDDEQICFALSVDEARMLSVLLASAAESVSLIVEEDR